MVSLVGLEVCASRQLSGSTKQTKTRWKRTEKLKSDELPHLERLLML